MDNNNWRPQPQASGGGGGEPAMEAGDWRTQLQPDSRERIINKIMETLKRHLPFPGQGGLSELEKIAVRFEEKIYIAATSQLDYLRKISMKMLTMETQQNPIPNNPNSNKPPEPEPAMEAGDWRTQLQLDSRQRIINKILETLKRHLPFSGQEGLLELQKIAVMFEEKIFSAATSQSDYLRKISMKMLTMETNSQNSVPNNPNSNRPPEPGTESRVLLSGLTEGIINIDINRDGSQASNPELVGRW